MLAFGPDGSGLAVTVSGGAWADITTADGAARIEAGHPRMLLRCALRSPVSGVRGGLSPSDNGAASTDRFSRLDAGTVRAGGLSFYSGRRDRGWSGRRRQPGPPGQALCGQGVARPDSRGGGQAGRRSGRPDSRAGDARRRRHSRRRFPRRRSQNRRSRLPRRPSRRLRNRRPRNRRPRNRRPRNRGAEAAEPEVQVAEPPAAEIPAEESAPPETPAPSMPFEPTAAWASPGAPQDASQRQATELWSGRRPSGGPPSSRPRSRLARCCRAGPDPVRPRTLSARSRPRPSR